MNSSRVRFSSVIRFSRAVMVWSKNKRRWLTSTIFENLKKNFSSDIYFIVNKLSPRAMRILSSQTEVALEWDFWWFPIPIPGICDLDFFILGFFPAIGIFLIREFFSRGLGHFEIVNFVSRTFGIILNLEIFIPVIGDFLKSCDSHPEKNRGIFHPRDFFGMEISLGGGFLVRLDISPKSHLRF